MAAAEAILAADTWTGTRPGIGGLLVQLGSTTASVVMLRHIAFSKVNSAAGIFTHGPDLLHKVVGLCFLPVANIMMAVAGTLYLLWFAVLARDLFRLTKINKT